MFQSTRPRGRTRRKLRLCGALYHVSIHASSREDATSAASLNSANAKFQSTRPRGRTRPALFPAVPCCPSFNPRVLAGGRDYLNLTLNRRMKFQSTRPRGRTRQELLALIVLFLVSIHASSREDATLISHSSFLILQFQSTRPRGRTRHCRRRH